MVKQEVFENKAESLQNVHLQNWILQNDWPCLSKTISVRKPDSFPSDTMPGSPGPGARLSNVSYKSLNFCKGFLKHRKGAVSGWCARSRYCLSVPVGSGTTLCT